jgi:hypothetical protein
MKEKATEIVAQALFYLLTAVLLTCGAVILTDTGVIYREKPSIANLDPTSRELNMLPIGEPRR